MSLMNTQWPRVGGLQFLFQQDNETSLLEMMVGRQGFGNAGLCHDHEGDQSVSDQSSARE
jgi:hypothetical protein